MLLQLVTMTVMITMARGIGQMAGLELEPHSSSGHFSGKFCFPLHEDRDGWKISVEFLSPVRDVQTPDGVWLEPHPPPGQCATIWMMGSQPGSTYSAGQTLCVSVRGGAVCKGGQPGATATLLDS